MKKDLDFGKALLAIKAGKRVTRPHYKDSGIFIFARPADTLPISIIDKVKSLPQYVKQVLLTDGKDVYFGEYLCMYITEGYIHNGYVLTQSDIFAEDWEILED